MMTNHQIDESEMLYSEEEFNLKPLTPAEEQAVSRLYNNVLKVEMPKWEAALSPEQIEIKKSNALILAKFWVQAGHDKELACRNKLYGLLKTHYGEEFAKQALDIEIGTMSFQEFTELVIKVQRILSQQNAQQDIEVLLRPYILRNPKYLTSKIMALEKNLSEAVQLRMQTEQTTLEMQEQNRQLKRQLATLGQCQQVRESLSHVSLTESSSKKIKYTK